MQLRRAARDVERGNVSAGEKTKHYIHGLAAHHFCSRRARLDMAVNTREITVAPHVDLKNVDRVPLEIAATPMNLLSKSLHERLRYLISFLLVSHSPCLSLRAAIRTRPAN